MTKNKIVVGITGKQAAPSMHSCCLKKLVEVKDQVADVGVVMSDNAKAGMED